MKRATFCGAGVALVLLLAGCGGGSQGAANGSVPVETVERPATTTVYQIPSSAMEPTLHCARPGSGCEADLNDRVVVEEPVRDPERGDILVFEAPPLAKQRCGAGGKFIKRLIALPGETWEEKNGVISIDGKELSEPYLTADRRDTGSSWPARTIPPGMYFMMGDNRTQSCDSREWGPVPRSNLIGKVVRIQREG
jgi:signal peptidase I